MSGKLKMSDNFTNVRQNINPTKKIVQSLEARGYAYSRLKTANFEQLKVLFSLFYDGFMVYKLLVYVVSI